MEGDNDAVERRPGELGTAEAAAPTVGETNNGSNSSSSSGDNNINTASAGVARGIVPDASNRAVRTTTVATTSNGRRVIVQQGSRRRGTGGMQSGFLLNQQGIGGARQRIIINRNNNGSNSVNISNGGNGSNEVNSNPNQTARTASTPRFVVPNGSTAGTAVPTLVQPNDGTQPASIAATFMQQRQRQARNSWGTANFAPGPPVPTLMNGIPMQNALRASFHNGSLTALPPLTPMPVLEAQPIPHQPTREIQFQGEKPPEDFECPICYQYLDDPSTCGHCESRFCFSCLSTTLAHETNHRLGMPSEQNQFKCPCCRRELRMEDVQRDDELKRLMDSSDVRCPYVCCAQLLKFSQLKAHEQTCPGVVLKCKYASLGCSWTGERRSLENHLNGDCAYARIGGLIRQIQTNHQSLTQHISHWQHQLAAVNRIAHQHQQTSMVSMNSTRNVHSIADIAAVMYNMMCHPVRFHHPATQTGVRQPWRAMFAGPRVRATVSHHLRLVPTGLLVVRIFFSSIRGLFAVADLPSPSTSSSWDVVLWIAFENLILAMAIAGVTVLLLVCLHIDGAGPTGWRSYDLSQLQLFGRSIFQNQGTNTRWLMLRDVSGVACAAIHLGAIEYFAVSTSSPQGLGGHLRGHFLWYCVCLATTLFPRLVDVHLRAAALVDSGTPRSSSAPMMVSQERTRSVVLFGLRYGFFFAVCHPIAVAEAILVRRLLEIRFGAKTTVVGTSSDGNTTVTTTANSSAQTTTFTITTTRTTTTSTTTTTTTTGTASSTEATEVSDTNTEANSEHAPSQTEDSDATNSAAVVSDALSDGAAGASDATVENAGSRELNNTTVSDTTSEASNPGPVNPVMGSATLNVTINENEAAADASPNGINLAVRVGDTPVNVFFGRKESFLSRLLLPLRDTEGFLNNLKSVPQIAALLICRLAVVVAPVMYGVAPEEQERVDREAATVRSMAMALSDVLFSHFCILGETIAAMMIVDYVLFMMTAAGDIGSKPIFSALTVSQQSQRTPAQPEEAIGMAARICSPVAFCTWAATLICILII